MNRLGWGALVFVGFSMGGCGDAVAPVWPSEAEVSVGGSTTESVTLGWPAATDDTSVTGYEVRVDGAAVASVGPDVREFSVEALSEAQEIRVEVVARDAAGNASEALSLQARSADETAPVFPEDGELELENLGEGVRLSWPPAEDASPVSYVIYRGDDEETTVEETTVELTRGVGSSHFRVVARDAQGHESGPLAAEWIAPPPAIEGVTTTSEAAGGIALRTHTAEVPETVRTRSSSTSVEVATRGHNVIGSGNAVTRISGTRHVGAVRRVIWEGLRARYNACYETALQSNPRLSGLLVSRVTISAAGRAESIEITDNHVTDQLAACVHREVRRAAFARGGGVGVFELRLQFERDN